MSQRKKTLHWKFEKRLSQEHKLIAEHESLPLTYEFTLDAVAGLSLNSIVIADAVVFLDNQSSTGLLHLIDVYSSLSDFKKLVEQDVPARARELTEYEMLAGN